MKVSPQLSPQTQLCSFAVGQLLEKGVFNLNHYRGTLGYQAGVMTRVTGVWVLGCVRLLKTGSAAGRARVAAAFH